MAFIGDLIFYEMLKGILLGFLPYNKSAISTLWLSGRQVETKDNPLIMGYNFLNYLNLAF